MPVRKADAVWEGNLKEGSGRIKLGSGALPSILRPKSLE